MIVYASKTLVKKSLTFERITHNQYGNPSDAAVRALLKLKPGQKLTDYARESTYHKKIASFSPEVCEVCAVGTVLYNILNPRKASFNLLGEAAAVAAADGKPSTYQPFRSIDANTQDRLGYADLGKAMVAKNWRKGDRRAYGTKVKQFLIDGRFMRALEYVFEVKIKHRAPQSEQRRKLLAFVDRFFPKWVPVDVNGADMDKIRNSKQIRFVNPLPMVINTSSTPVTGAIENAESVVKTSEKTTVVTTPSEPESLTDVGGLEAPTAKI